MAPASFGKYTVTEQLGSGGMAEVYAGVHPDLGRKVAIKVILPQFATEPDFEARFRREARVVASLRHAHIVRLYDFDVVDGRHFMVMEYLDGGTLKDRLRTLHQQQARMSLSEIADLLDALGDALDYAHGRGAIHRDIKPANILFTAEREPVLTDFGIAKLLGDAASLTATGGVLGSPYYIPPEQAGGSEVGARSDQYSLGVVAYEMATGQVPFQGNSAMAVVTQHLHHAPPAPRTVNAALPTAVEAVLLKALAKQPDDRFGSAGEFAAAFRDAVNGRAAVAASGAATDENARTVVDQAGAEATFPSLPQDAATVVTPPSAAGPPLPLNATPTDPLPDQGVASSPAPNRQASLPAVDSRPADDEPPALPAPSAAQLATQPPKPTAQTFHVGGIQAGVVNQGGEQTFSGDLTFNLDFGDIQAAPRVEDSGQANATAGGDAGDLAVILAALRRAFAGSARVDRFVRLVNQFQGQLEALPADRTGDRNQVVKRVQALLMEMTEAKPDPDMVEIMGTSLQRAVQPLAAVDPDLTTMATRITSWVELMVEPE